MGNINYIKIVSMVGKYHNHKVQATPWYPEEEANTITSNRDKNRSNQLSLPHRDNCKARMDTKKRTTKHRTVTESHNGSNIQQRINNDRAPPKNGQQPKPLGRGLNAFYRYQIFALDFVLVEAQYKFNIFYNERI